jgi:hypothetical protein
MNIEEQIPVSIGLGQLSDRSKAQEIVENYRCKFEQYSVVTAEDALMLLGDYRFNLLLNDKIRGVAPATLPTNSAFYYWNIVDYLLFPINDKQVGP